MRVFSTFLHHLLIPALVGCSVALAVLFYAPELKNLFSLWDTESATPQPKAQASAKETQPEAPHEEVTPKPEPEKAPLSYANAVDIATPAVVNIYTRTLVKRQLHPIFDDPLFQRFFRIQPQPTERIQSSLGSGVIMRADGYVITNNHVITGADEIVVALRDGRDANALVVGADPEADLAVLKIELNDLPVITLSQKKARVGDVVLAIGNPFGVGQTVTMGIVSATGRNHLGLSTYENYIQTDAAINPGNSGGALVNTLGELVGLNTAIFSKSGGNQGIGFAIPASVAERTVEDIIAHGSPVRGWLGVEVQEATPALLDALQLPKELSGLIVTGIYPQGPADKAGLSVGDIIVKINSSDTTDAHETMNLIATARPGDNLTIEFLHAGKRISTQAQTGERKSQAKN